jgi:hypothetical protein
MSLAAVPRPAAAAGEVHLRFELTVKGQPPSEKQLQLFVSPPPLSPNQTGFVFCGGQGTGQDGTTYHWDFPHVPAGTVETYRFQVETLPRMTTVVIASGKLRATKDQTIRTTFNFNAGTMPNTAVARRPDGSEAVVPALGILLVLLAAAISARRRPAQAPISAE